MKFTDDDLNMADTQDEASSSGGDEDRTMSLMNGVARPEGMADADGLDVDALTDDAGGSGGLLSQGTLLIAVLVAIAGVSLYLMRMSQGDMGPSETAKEVEAKIEQALAKLIKPDSLSTDDPLRQENLAALFQNTETVLAMFAHDPTKRQVPLSFVKKDPFDLMMKKDEPKAAVVQKGDDAAELRRRTLALELKNYKLQSVIQGARPTAIISNDIVQPGQRLGSFRVRAIDAFSVTLVAGNDMFVLKMDNPTAGGR